MKRGLRTFEEGLGYLEEYSEESMYDYSYAEEFYGKPPVKVPTPQVPTEPDEPKIAIRMTVRDNIPYGDPDRKALGQFIEILLGLPSDHFRVLRAVKVVKWTSEFPETTFAVDRNVTMPISVFLNVLEAAYVIPGTYGTDELYMQFVDLKSMDFTQIQLLRILYLLYGTMTNNDAYYFSQWLSAKRPNVPQIEGLKVSYEAQKLHIEALADFIDHKIQYITELGKLKDFSLAEDDLQEKKAKFKYLIERVNTMDITLLDDYLKIDDPGVLKVLDMATGSFYEYFQTIDKEKRLNAKGFEFWEIDMVLDMFQEIAISESFELLTSSLIELYKEYVRYEKDSEAQKLFAFIQRNYRGRFRAADIERAKGALKYMQYMKKKGYSDILKYLGGDSILGKMSRRDTVTEMADYVQYLHVPDMIRAMGDGIYFAEKRFLELDFAGRSSEFYYKQVYSDYPEFGKADKMDQETYGKMETEGVKEYPILGDGSIDFRRLSLLDVETFQTKIREEISSKMKNNRKVQKDLADDPETIWKLELVIEKVMQQYSIGKDSAAGKIIENKRSYLRDMDYWKSFGMGALSLGLTIAGFFTFGATWVGATITGLGMALGAYDVYKGAEEFSFDSSARDTAIGVANELSAKEPELFGLILSVLGLVSSLTVFIKPLKNVSEVVGNSVNAVGTEIFINDVLDGFSELNKLSTDSPEFEASASRLYDIIGKDNITVSKKEFIERLKQAGNNGQTFKTNDALEKLLSKVMNVVQVREFMKGPQLIGLRMIYEKDQNLAKIIIREYEEHPELLGYFSVQALYDADFPSVLSKMYRLLYQNDQKLVITGLIFLANYPKAIEGLDKLNLQIANAEITNPWLILEILKSTQLRVMFVKMRNPGFVKGVWIEYSDTKPVSTFEEFALSKINTRDKHELHFSEKIKANLRLVSVSDNEEDYQMADNSIGGAFLLPNVDVESKEISLADKIYLLTDQKSVFPIRRMAGIEGFHENGDPFSMKELEKGFGQFTPRLNEMYITIKESGMNWMGVEGYVKLKFDTIPIMKNGVKIRDEVVDQKRVEYYFNRVPRQKAGVRENGISNQILNDGTLKRITVFLKDGSNFPLDLTKLKTIAE